MACNRNEAMQMPARAVERREKEEELKRERSLGGEEKGKAGSRSEEVTEQSSPKV